MISYYYFLVHSPASLLFNQVVSYRELFTKCPITYSPSGKRRPENNLSQPLMQKPVVTWVRSRDLFSNY